jgi:diaminopimelate decarboxylase
MTPATASALAHLASRFGTPSYVYFVEPMRKRVEWLRAAFGERFAVSYAIKSNPNVALLRALAGSIEYVDASSAGEVTRALRAGFDPTAIAF